MTRLLILFNVVLLFSSLPALSQNLTEEQMRIYERACTTGLSVTVEVDTGLTIFRQNFIDGKGKLSQQQIATLLSENGLKTDDSKIKALTLIQDCYRQYIERFSASPSVLPPVNVQQAFLSVISQIASFKRYGTATIQQMPNKFEIGFDIITPKTDPKLVDMSNYLRYAAFLDPSGSQIDLNRLTRENFSVLCQNFFQEVEDFNSVAYFLYSHYNNSWGEKRYTIPEAIKDICKRR